MQLLKAKYGILWKIVKMTIYLFLFWLKGIASAWLDGSSHSWSTSLKQLQSTQFLINDKVNCLVTCIFVSFHFLMITIYLKAPTSWSTSLKPTHWSQILEGAFKNYFDQILIFFDTYLPLHSAQFDPICFKILSKWEKMKEFFKAIFSVP